MKKNTYPHNSFKKRVIQILHRRSISETKKRYLDEFQVGLWIINSQCQFSRHFLIQFLIDIEMLKKVRGSEIAAAVSESISCSSSCMCHPSHCKINKNFPSITEDGKTWFSSCYIGAIVVSPNLSKICNEHSTVKLFWIIFHSLAKSILQLK